jgi:hypothetical protein
MRQWLREHAEDLDLIHDGKPNETAIEEICKVANWRPKGGAPPTPANASVAISSRPLIRLPAPEPQFGGLDDEIPF